MFASLFAALLTVTPAHGEMACPDYASDPGRLVALEEEASRGALSQEQRDCLELRYAAAAEQTVKNKISRVLLVNAYAYDTSYWASLVTRHLDEVDRSDPDIAYLYAFYLYHHDSMRSEEVIRWTDVALERRDTWTGKVFVARVDALLKLRAIAANAVWQRAEEPGAAGADPTSAEVDDLRNRTKTFAREWVDFAKVSGRPVDEAMALCLSAASRAIACGAEE